MNRCIQLAKLGAGFVAPNPMVGCILVHKNKIVAEGYHKKYGEAHAEVNAFAALSDEVPVNECDMYVSLEPCSHFGKTPPCADLIIQKNPKKVYVGCLDPNPKVAGFGLQRIVNAGIPVLAGILESECNELNKKFVTYHTKRRPFVTLKWAETEDGFMGRLPTENYLSKKISSEKNNAWVHELRANHMAIMVGAKTINSDNPKLDIRYWEGKNPLKVILSKRLHLDLSATTFCEYKSLVINGIKDETNENIQYVKVDDFSAASILNTLYQLEIQSVLIEGGSEILKLFLIENLWDEAIIIGGKARWDTGILAPKLTSEASKIEDRFGDTIKFYQNKWA